MRQARLRFWCDLTIWPLAALALLGCWLALLSTAVHAAPKADPVPVSVGAGVVTVDIGYDTGIR